MTMSEGKAHPLSANGKVAPYSIIPARGFPSYDFLCTVLGMGQGFRQEIMDRLGLQGNEHLLDLGCGSGALLERVCKHFPHVAAAGIDPDPVLLDVAKRRLEPLQQHAVSCGPRSEPTHGEADGSRPRVDLRLAQAEALPFPDGSFDVVVSSLAFHHLPTDAKQAALQEAYRVLRRGGRLLLVDFGGKQGWLVRCWQMVFERGEFIGDHAEGRIPEFIAEANFSNVRRLARRWPSLEYYAAEKAVT